MYSRLENTSTDKKRKNSATKKKEMPAGMENSASSAASCNVLVDTCHEYYGPKEKMEFSVMSVEDFPSFPATPLKPPSNRGRGESNDDIVMT